MLPGNYFLFMIQDIEPHSFDNHFQPQQMMTENDYLFYFEGNKLLLLRSDDEEGLVPRLKDFDAQTSFTNSYYLFSMDGDACFLVNDVLEVDNSRFELNEINFFRKTTHPEIGFISVVAYHLHCWYAEHRFCGKCGTATVHKADERAMACPNCNTLFFPKISPAIIVAIVSGDKILLAHNTNFPNKWFSLIAGYADVGESLEATVRREVKEEVGIDVHHIRYYASQPWSLSGSMMIGYVAEADDNQPIVVDETEIAEAAWFRRGALPDHPTAVSIAGEMIDKFERGVL